MEIKGFIHYNCVTKVFDVVCWVEDSGAIQTSGLSTMNAQLYDKDGTTLSYSVVGLAPEALGIYNFDSVEDPSFIADGSTYLLRVETGSLSTFLPFTIVNI